jgi:hypothetical protein
MKKALILLFVALLSQAAYAQRDSVVRHRSDEIRTLANSTRHFGFYGALSFRNTRFNGEGLMMAGARLGFIANRSLGIGFEAHGVIPTTRYPDVLPGQQLVALGGYGGLNIEAILFSNKAIHLTFPVSAGGGWLGYFEDWNDDFPGYDGDLVVDDVFWYVEPGAHLEANISRSLRLYGGVSRRFVQDLHLPNTPEGAFEGMSYTFGIKIGRF